MRALANKLEVLVTWQQLPLGHVIVETFHSMAPTIWSRGARLPEHFHVYRGANMNFDAVDDEPRWWLMSEDEVLAKYDVVDLANEGTVGEELKSRSRPLSG